MLISCCYFSYFDYIKEKYRIADDVFEWFDFVINASSLFGILPGIIIKLLAPKKSAILGGLLIVAGQMMSAMLISSEHQHIKDNPAWVLATICILVGQGSCMVLLSSLQALMNLQTIQASHVISTCLFAYYMAADTFIMAVKDGLFPDTTFTKFTMQLGIEVFIVTVIQAFVITDEEDEEGFFGKAVALTKGIIYKKTNYMHIIILAVYTSILMMAYFGGEMKG